MLLKSVEADIAQLPCWAGPIAIHTLDGGMTNHNYRVRCGEESFVVRLGHDLPEHGVMRFNELAAARAAHAAGISPEVVFSQPGTMVSRFIEGRTLTDQDVRDPRLAARLVDLIHACHHSIPRHLRGPVLMFWVFQVIRNYAGVLHDAVHNPLAHRMAALASTAAQLESAIGPVQLVFGHNDLLAANFIDDGKRLWLLDWDYAGFNSPLFDLANLSSNNSYSVAQDHALLERYFRKTPDAQLLRAFMAMKCASLMREVLWGAVSQITSTIAFDYVHYTNAYLARLDGMLVEAQFT
jgi:thiamine kinase-like enzyme